MAIVRGSGRRHDEPKRQALARPFRLAILLDVLIALFAIPLPRQGFLGPAAFAGLQVKGVALDLLDDVFLLDLALETAECAFERFTFLHEYFGQ